MNVHEPPGPVFHGGGLDRAMTLHGGNRADWLDLSTGINPRPWPAPPVSADSWQRLPDAAAHAWLVAVARKYYRVPEGFSVVPAPGTQSLIEALPKLLDGSTATIIAPQAGTYREHANCCAKAGRTVGGALSPYDVPQDETLAIAVHPNNPDGYFHDKAAMLKLADKMRLGNGRLGEGRLIIDEAFCDTDPDSSFVPHMPRNVIVLKSFGKFFGLAGLRLGFAICERQMAGRIADHLGPWAVSGPALEIGAAALADRQWAAATRHWLAARSQAMAEMLRDNGMEIVGANGLFVLAWHERAAPLHDALQRSRILVRPFPDREGLVRFGLVADDAQMRRLRTALQSFFKR
jgi:cobalamin biosynthesis protein CobC